MKEFLINLDKKILVIAPHPDDESIGCGALLSRYGEQCDVIVLTDGCYGNPEWTNNRTSRVRKKEAQAAMASVGVSSTKFLNIQDNALHKYSNCLYEIDLSIYDYIFVTGKEDGHSDHKAAYRALICALEHQKIRKMVCQYEVWTPLIDFTHYLNFDPSDKEDIIKYYECQLKHVDYLKMTRGLGMYRASQLHMEGEKLAEVYIFEESGYERKWFNLFG